MAELVYTRPAYYPAAFAARIINVVVAIIELLLALRVLFELLGASPYASFIAWIYSASGSLIAPFMGAFPSIGLGSGSVIDLWAILGMIAYAVLGWLLVQLVYFVFTSAA